MNFVITIDLQILLALCSVGTFVYAIQKIRKSKVRIDDMIIWILGSLVLLLFSLFPRIVFWAADMVGFIKPVNFIVTGVIFVLLILLFRQAVALSQLKERLSDLTQEIALLTKDLEDKQDNVNVKDRGQ